MSPHPDEPLEFAVTVTNPAVPEAGSEPASMHVPVGYIARYRVKHLLGAGGMGMVYAPHDPELGRSVALKLIRIASDGDDAACERSTRRLLREARAMARISHPNVVTVHDVGVVDGQVFVAMERVHGLTLAQWLRREPRSWQDVVRVFVQAAQGLAAAHAVGLVHRDFKPENVIVGEDGRVRVLDFGLARAAEDDEGEDAGREGNSLATGLRVT
jgi:eukaryotic-like serine/threonine-protein kinase